MNKFKTTLHNLIERVVHLNSRYRIITALAVVCVFVTTYSLILPAITLEQDKADEIGIKSELASGDAEEAGSNADAEAADSNEDAAAGETGEEAAETEKSQTSEESGTDVAGSDAADSTAGFGMRHFKEKTEDRSVKVAVDAEEGAFAEDVTMKVTAVEDQKTIDAVKEAVDGEVTSVTAVDISFFDKEGNEVEPAKGRTVSVTITSDAVKSAENPAIVHVTEDKRGDLVGEVIENTEVDKKNILFETDSFSVYAIIDGEISTARAAVTFHNGSEEIATMYIKNSDELLDGHERDPYISYIEDIIYEPGAGSMAAGETFRGWTTNPNYTEADAKNAMTINDVRRYLANNVVGNIEEGDKVDLYAVIYKHFDITYFGQDEGVSLGTDAILYPRTKDPAEAEYTVNMAFAADANRKFIGWKAVDGTHVNIKGATDADAVYPNTTEITITGNVTFKAEAPVGCWLVFHENADSATYNAPGFFLVDEPTVQPENAKPAYMNRTGYSFAGWYKLKDGETLTDADKDEKGNYIIGNKFEAFTFGSPLTDDVDIYAKWTPNATAPYTVVLWTENINSIGKPQSEKIYDLADSYSGTGTVGQNIAYTYINNGDEDYVRIGSTDYHYTGFDLIPGSQQTSVTITPEGDAILNLYYNRIKYDLRFYLYRKNGNGNKPYEFANGSKDSNNIWGVVGWHNSTTEDNMPTTTYPGGIKSQTGVDGDQYTGYYIELSAYYGQDISTLWPRYDQIGTAKTGNNTYSPVSYVMMVGTKLKPRPSGSGDGTIKGVYTFMDENILGATNDADGNFLIVRFSTYNNWTYHLYFEAYEGQDISGKTTKTLNGKTYYLGEDYPSRSSNTDAGQQNAPQYTGFKAVMQSGSRPYYDGYTQNVPVLNYYYDRQKYPIHYMDGIYVGGDDNTDILARNTLREIHKSDDIPYDAPVPDDDKNYKPNSSDASQPGFVFEGWYLDAACTTPYEFDTMPDHPITVYSKWVQEQYRVFLHPNAEDSSSNPGLNWGSDEQAMTYRIGHGGRVSTPKGVWTDGKKAFVAWLDKDGNIFDGNVFVLNDETVTADYDKTDPGNYTDVMDKWGKGATYNDDENEDRWWITKKLDLYALWRDVMNGADGISVVYNATGLDASDPSKTITGKINNQDTYTDPLKYLDNTVANATAAALADDPAYKFLYWVVQKWDPEADGGHGAYVDVIGENGEPVTAYPGAGFTVLASYAKVTTDAEDDTKKTYTLQLRAEYTPNNRAKCTIRWYQNDHEDSELLHEDTGLLINQATDIYTLEAGESIPTRKGYKFIGWARDNEYDVDPTTYKPVGDPITYHGGLTEDDLYFKYYTDGDTYGYLAKNDNNEWADVSRIAADESLMYQALYAVWEPLSSVAVLKVDVDDPAQYLDGAVFKLTKKNAAGQYVDYGENPYTTSEIYIGDTKQKGAFKIDEIETGDYRLTESTAPDGYIIETKNIDFSVNIINKKAEITITSGSDIARVDSSDKDKLIISNKSGTPLPLTGGLGTQIYTLGGALLIIAAASMYGFRMRRRGRRSN